MAFFRKHVKQIKNFTKAISNFLGKLKGKSTYHLRKHHWNDVKNKLWGEHYWSPSYCIASCGGAPLDIVKNYVQSQNSPSKYQVLPA